LSFPRVGVSPRFPRHDTDRVFSNISFPVEEEPPTPTVALLLLCVHMPRTKGSRDLSLEERAEILAEKSLRLSTRDEIAEQHGVCRDTVMKITPDTEPHEVVIRAKQIEADIKDRIERVRDKTLDALEHAIDNDEIRKESLINAFSTLYDKARVEGGQPTHHVGFSPEQVDRFRNGFRNLLINLFQNFHADQERETPIDRTEAERLVKIALGEG